MIDIQFTESEKEAILLLINDIVGTGKTAKFFYEERNRKNVLMVSVQND